MSSIADNASDVTGPPSVRARVPSPNQTRHDAVKSFSVICFVLFRCPVRAIALPVRRSRYTTLIAMPDS
ncbi:hypothetical protein QQF64_011693 [Cirrhinus molitorella]|uniref:Uncharacterized protein n=1 Tax=Cirrhinus molitorella TaxID=172907 RepID=A0ABR3M3G0_9TELE